MLSLKALIDKTDPYDHDVFRRVALILLEGVALNAFPHSTEEFTAFQASIEGIRARLNVVRDEDAAVLLAGKAIHCLEEYGAAAERFVSLQKQQMRKTIDLLTESLLQISRGSAESAANLRSIQRELESASQMDDLAAVNGKLQICLESICKEASRQRARESEIAAGLSRAVLMEKSCVETDAVTGLPGMEAAIQAIRAAISSGSTGRVMAYGVERMEAINHRFGFRIGDQILFLFAQHIAQRLHPEDVLFRWRGPCFAVVSARPAPDAALASDAARITGTRLEHTITVGEREIVVPIVGSWTMLPLGKNNSLDAVLDRLDEFALHRTGAPALSA